MSEKPIFKRILVGYDGSENADRALGRAIALALKSKGELRIVVVADTRRYTATVGLESLYKQFDEKTRKNAENLAGAALEQAKSAGIANPFSSVEVGHPSDMILSVAADDRSDLIVVGRRGIGGLERFLLGSVSTAVISTAKSDVLVVK